MTSASGPVDHPRAAPRYYATIGCTRINGLSEISPITGGCPNLALNIFVELKLQSGLKIE